MKPRIKGISFVGIKTEKFTELHKFYTQTLGLKPDHYEPDFATYPLPNGGKIEIYGPNDPNSPNHDEFTTGPVVGFEVDDIAAERKAMEADSVEFLAPIYSGRNGRSQWSHFRGPDGNVYEIKQKAA